MKKLFLTGFMFFMFAAVNAQIGDVQQKGNYLVSYNGTKQIGKFAIAPSKTFLGFSSSIIVVQMDNYIISYDESGNELGKFAIHPSKQFKSVMGENINIIDGRYLITYSISGNQISKRGL